METVFTHVQFDISVTYRDLAGNEVIQEKESLVVPIESNYESQGSRGTIKIIQSLREEYGNRYVNSDISVSRVGVKQS